MALRSLRGDIEPWTNEYKNKTMVSNWWEDRHVNGGNGARPLQTGKLTDGQLNSTQRVMATDVAPEAHMPLDLRTTKQAMDQSMQQSTPPKKIVKPAMHSPEKLPEQLKTYGDPVSLVYTHGRAAEALDAPPPDRHLETTNQHFYAKLPEQATATCSDPAYFAPPDRSHYKHPALRRDAYVTEHPDLSEERGGKGARGEITRRPGESGNVYGVSVYVDEYSKWGTALKGVTHGETVRNMQTKYF